MKPGKIAMTVTLGWWLLAHPMVTSASTILFQDSFEDNDFSNWTVVRNAQSHTPALPCMNGEIPAAWNIVNGELGIEINGPSCMTEIIPNNLDLAGHDFVYSFDWHFKESTMMDRVVIFIWKDPRNWYDFKILGDSILLQKVANGSVYDLAGGSGGFDFSPDKIYHFEITVKERDTITLKIDGHQVIQVTDTLPHIDGFRTVGLQAGVGAIRRSVSYFDNIVVTSLNAPRQLSLNVPLLKQTDPQWKNDIYDRATSWAQNPTIDRWGCALTSMAMIMKYYGLHSLPDGQPVNPSTLNAWLTSQPDGYVGAGALNWIAIGRLTRLISDQLGTPKLEYRRHEGEALDLAIEEIKGERPVILQIAGHFLVGDGINSELTDVLIKDPAYSYTSFGQHQKPLISTRTFLPSHTDLSYILLTHKPGLQVTILDAAGNSLPNLQTFTDTIADPTSVTQTTPAVIQTQLAQPAEGTYQLVVSQPTLGPFELQVISYDATGNPSMKTLNGVVGNQALTYELHYSKTTASSIPTPKVTFSSFRRDLLVVKQANQFRHQVVFTLLDTLARVGMNTSSRLQPYRLTIAQVIAKQLSVHSRFIKDTGYHYLLQQTQALMAHLRR